MKLQGGKREQFLFDIREHIARFLFPRACVVCGCEGAWLCTACMHSVPVNRHAFVRRAYSDLDGVSALSWYANPAVQRLIRLLKYHSVTDVCTAMQSLIALFYGQFSDDAWQVDAVVPVPLHARRLRQRGFNQAQLLSHIVARQLDIPVCNGLKRIVSTVSQTAVEKKDRHLNMRGAFCCASGVAIPPRVVLVDDVITTGATLGACARALRAAGARQVYCFVIAAEGER